MDEFAVLIGGKAGDGIDRAGLLIGQILNQLGKRIYIYRDYPSVIRGGHTFSIIRATKEKKSTCREKIDFLLALNQDCIDLHKNKLVDNAVIIYDSGSVKIDTLPASVKTFGIALDKIIKEENAQPVMRNSCIIASLAKALGLDWNILEKVFKKYISREVDLNLKVALRAFNETEVKERLESTPQKTLPLLTGNDAISLGLINAGLNSYIAYPMTPTSNILHFLAGIADDFGLKVIHPENEIAVSLMALGFAYSGKRAAVGTSGGGFCLMTESVSLAAMAELPIVIVVGQRTGPSTGLPTYTGQSDLHFALNAGHGEFTRFLVAPGDAEEAYLWAGIALNLSWKYQIPSIVLVDKTTCEGTFSFDIDSIEKLKIESPLIWDRNNSYKRYQDSPNGVSPLAFIPEKDQVIKVDSYEHDEYGITTEDAQITRLMQGKRLRKCKFLAQDLAAKTPVKIYGKTDSSQAIICWGSNKGVCIEIGAHLGLKVIQPLVLSPFPKEQLLQAISGVNLLINVENNITGQLSRLLNCQGIKVDKQILKYDGRPFFLEELEREIKKVL
jgi:2-oxoglutarate ferredoxin oxidoreductase subunit alpha